MSQWPNMIFQNITPGGNGGGWWAWAKLVGVLVAVAVAMRACAWLLS